MKIRDQVKEGTAGDRAGHQCMFDISLSKTKRRQLGCTMENGG